jgi:hypothetical protein
MPCPNEPVSRDHFLNSFLKGKRSRSSTWIYLNQLRNDIVTVSVGMTKKAFFSFLFTFPLIISDKKLVAIT